MKLIDNVIDILCKYNLRVDIPDEYKSIKNYASDHPKISEELFFDSDINDYTLNTKYKNNIGKGWYGFAIGHPTPTVWFTVIDKILEHLIEEDPDLEIQQIKMKFGGIRFYVESKIIEDIFDISVLISNKMYDEKLIY